MEPTKSFVFQGDELAWLLSGRALPACPPVEALAAAPFESWVFLRTAGKFLRNLSEKLRFCH